MRRSILAVQGPLQYLVGSIAMKWLVQNEYKTSYVEKVLVLFDLCVPESEENDFAETIYSLASGESWTKILFISTSDMKRINRTRISQRLKFIREEIGFDNCDDIFVMRDFAFLGNQLLLNAYPKAQRITYGDSFGIVGDNKIFKKNWYEFIKRPLLIIKFIASSILFGRYKTYTFDKAVLLLPQDWSGSYLDNIPLIIPEKSFVLKDILNVGSSINRLQEYCDSILQQTASKKYLFLLSNFTNSGMMQLDKEMNLYYEIIIKYIEFGSTIIFKKHPRCNLYLSDKVKQIIEKRYNIFYLDDNRFSSIPLEYFFPIISACEVISVYSASALHLTYLYNKNVIMPLDNDLIDYFFSNVQVDVKKGNSMMVDSVKKLKFWDGNSILWKGN